MPSLNQLDDDARAALRGWLERPRYEVLPLPGVVDELSTIPVATVTITASPAKGLNATLDIAEQIRGLGHHVVPHVAARQVHHEDELAEIASRLELVGIDEVFVVAGDGDEPGGAFSGAADLLESLSRLSPDLTIGIAGYPESHPKIPDAVTRQALVDKSRYASYIVSQVCFDADTISTWLDDVRWRDVTLPVMIGVPGPISTTRLLKVASRIGVGQSLRFLAGHGNMARLVRPGAYDPVPLLADTASASVRPDGVHFYTFNEVAATEAWRQRVLVDLIANDRRWVG